MTSPGCARIKDNISQADRNRLKQASQSLLASLRALLTPMYDWTKNTSTQAEVKVCISDNLWQSLPRPPFTDEETRPSPAASITMSGNGARAALPGSRHRALSGRRALTAATLNYPASQIITNMIR